MYTVDTIVSAGVPLSGVKRDQAHPGSALRPFHSTLRIIDILFGYNIKTYMCVHSW